MKSKTGHHSEEGYKGSSGAVCFGVLRRTLPRSSGFTPQGLSRNPSEHVFPTRGVFPRGFTLVEVVVAAAVLIILIIGLSGVFARGVSGFKQAQLMTLGQNLAEFLVEDVKNLAPSVLNKLVLGEYQNVNYPYPTTDAEALTNDGYPWMYDSGKLRTDFKLDWIERLGEGFLAGGYASTVPMLPNDTDVLLGDNIAVRAYITMDDGTTYWKDSEEDGWYYTDGSGNRHDLPEAPVQPPFQTDDPHYYYQIVLQKEAYPQFSRRIRIAEYDWDTPLSSDAWDPHLPSEFRDGLPAPTTRSKYEYEVTIWYRRNGIDSVLIRTGGTIGSPFGCHEVLGSAAS
jgi:type II secretory pathway pseudopilin PulG